MREFTAQEIFDLGAAHLLRQNKRAISSEDEDFGTCFYRAPDGAQCPVGFLMDHVGRERYSNEFEGIAGDHADLLRHYPELAPHAVLLRELQLVHDNSPLELWADALVGLAAQFGLNPEITHAHK
jgi:hypothetical protein